jgi:hypothetical protein
LSVLNLQHGNKPSARYVISCLPVEKCEVTSVDVIQLMYPTS